MPDTLTRTTRLLQGRCAACGKYDALPLQHWCARCRDREAAQRHRVGPRQRRVVIDEPAAGPNCIAHCGAWHPVATLPWTCPACGWALG